MEKLAVEAFIRSRCALEVFLVHVQEATKGTGLIMKMKENKNTKNPADSISQWPNGQWRDTAVAVCSCSKAYSEYSILQFVSFSCHVCEKLNCSSWYKSNSVICGPFPVTQTRTSYSKWAKATCLMNIIRDYKTDS